MCAIREGFPATCGHRVSSTSGTSEGRFLLHPCNLADKQSWQIHEKHSLCIPPKWVMLNCVQKCFPILLLGGELAPYCLSLWAAPTGSNAVLSYHQTNNCYWCKIIYLDWRIFRKHHVHCANRILPSNQAGNKLGRSWPTVQAGTTTPLLGDSCYT